MSKRRRKYQIDVDSTPFDVVLLGGELRPRETRILNKLEIVVFELFRVGRIRIGHIQSVA